MTRDKKITHVYSTGNTYDHNVQQLFVSQIIMIMRVIMRVSQLLGTECVFKHQDLQMFCLKLKKIWVMFTHFFYSLEVVSRYRDTQLQVSKKK